jgi:hypothetical protein
MKPGSGSIEVNVIKSVLKSVMATNYASVIKWYREMIDTTYQKTTANRYFEFSENWKELAEILDSMRLMRNVIESLPDDVSEEEEKRAVERLRDLNSVNAIALRHRSLSETTR